MKNSPLSLNMPGLRDSPVANYALELTLYDFQG